ncbi:APC family permease [Robertkochia aurantiaca]|uniref:APC family permease n=1 Tax=Robertkochia aurantiaca TaxID=2873700 RepID=UPI001CCD4CED|nr:APC family permease [Robertkochia sp. 3YJGBD-33]
MSKNNNSLKRTLGFWDVLFFGIGGIIGAGIYAIIGEAAALGGNLLWLSFLIAAVIALLTGLTYAEFVSRFPDAGGSYEYIKQGMGERTALFMSFFMTFTGVVAAAAIAISFADYLGRLLDIPLRLTITGIIALMALFNIVGAKYSSNFNRLATVITVLGLLLVIIVCIPDIGDTDLLKTPEEGITGIFAGSALIFFSYIGFEDLVKLAEETKKPRKNLPKAILLSGLIVLGIYVLIAISAVSSLGAERLASSPGPLAAVIEKKLGKTGAIILVVVALFATSKTILSNILGTSRLLFDVARDTGIRWLEKFTTLEGMGEKTPNYAIVAIALIAIGFGLIGNLKIVASISNIFIFIVFGMVNIALIRYRYKNKNAENSHRGFRIPLNISNVPIPTILALGSLAGLMAYNIYNML